jgi:serine/threonine protein kinase
MGNIDELEHIIGINPEKRLGERVGNYLLTGWLGRGALADVYLGEHIYLKRPCAIKMLHVHLSEKAMKAFLNEACTIAGLDHPHIVQVLDYGVENGTPFLVMAYAPNGSVRQRFPEGMRVPLEQIVPLVQQMASALDYAHQQRLIHRDIKPENILLEAQDQALLSDFGLVLVAQSIHTQAVTTTTGTILYMAPEMLEGKVHFASDQYALGIMTYEWLCGQCPFTGSFIQVATQHVVAPPPSLCERVPDLPPSVEHVVFKALAKDRAQRYENVIAFANALQDACKDVLSINDNISIPQSSFPLSERQLEPRETPTIAQTLLPLGLDTNVLSEKQASSESVSGSSFSFHTASDRDIPLTRRTQHNRSKLLLHSRGKALRLMVLLCVIGAAVASAFWVARTPTLITSSPSTQKMMQVVDLTETTDRPTAQPSMQAQATNIPRVQPSMQATSISIVPLSSPIPASTIAPTPSPPVSYEAEATNNTLAHGATVVNCPGGVCSGGQRVGYIGLNSGNAGTLQFNNVNKNVGGRYTLTIYYLIAGSDTVVLYISVNGGSAVALNVTQTPNGDTVGTANITISLNAGSNTIKISNPSNAAPDIDRIVV